MKRTLSILLLLCLMFATAGCMPVDKGANQKITFYYRSGNIDYEDGEKIFRTEERSVNTKNTDLAGIVRLYLSGPQDDSLVASFPAGTTLVDLQLEEMNITVILGGSYASLSGHEKTLACAFLTMTLCPIANVPQLTVLAENDPPDSDKGIVMRPENFVFTDDSKIPIEENQ